MRTAVAQFGPTTDAAANLETIERLITDAVAQGAALVVLPEESMLLADGLDDPLAELVETAWPAFERRLAQIAAEQEVALIAGGYEPNGTDRPSNTLIAIDDGGRIVTRYRKLHVYDAFAYQESGYVSPGAELPPVIELAGVRVGLVNCYDVRFPELTRHLLAGAADLITISAAWVAGHRKEDHWETLVRARAIENTVWVAAAGSISPDCIGGSLIVDPFGIIRAGLGEQLEAVAVVDVTADRTAEVRRKLPALANRRIDLAMSIKD